LSPLCHLQKIELIDQEMDKNKQMDLIENYLNCFIGLEECFF